MRRAVLLLLPFLFHAAPAAAESGIRLIPPVDAPVAAGFDAPESDFGPGHRGIDYDLVAGTPVRAAGEGTVTFAAEVAGLRAVLEEERVPVRVLMTHGIPSSRATMAPIPFVCP